MIQAMIQACFWRVASTAMLSVYDLRQAWAECGMCKEDVLLITGAPYAAGLSIGLALGALLVHILKSGLF